MARYPSPPLNGFDQAAYDIHASVNHRARGELRRAEGRDGVSWLQHSALDPDRIAWLHHELVTDPDISRRLSWKVYRIRVNEHLLVRITGNPVNFLANKTDHYIPEDCKVEFIPVPMREDI